LNFNQEIEGNILLYEDKQLVSLIIMFIPTSEEAELSAYTLPEYRQRGYFKRLLTEAIEEIKKYKIRDLIFVCEPQSKDGIEAIKRLKVELDFTEYFLRLKNYSENRELSKNRLLKLYKAEPEDKENLISLSQDIFEDSYEDAKNIITRSFEADNRLQYIAKLDEVLVGMGAVSFENEEASISGLGISPQYQGKGFGQDLLNLILSELKRDGTENITIEVDSNNEVAFNLYKICGFEVVASFNYYRKRI
jgi:ribosomal protein S18 acetylase RimI-like enzyme